MQPYFFPYIGYYQAVSAVDKYLLYDDLAYIKRGWINRNRYRLVNGVPVYFIVPVKGKSSFTKIKAIEIDDQSPWRKKMLRGIYYNYKRAPFFEDVYPLIERIIDSDVRLLTDLNASSIVEVSRYLGIPTEISTDAGRYADLECRLDVPDERLMDNFSEFQVTVPERKVLRALAICRAEGAHTFINAIGGQELYRKEEFSRNKIDLQFLKRGDIRYQQFSSKFRQDLSIIDVLMHCGRDGTRALLSEYVLV